MTRRRRGREAAEERSRLAYPRVVDAAQRMAMDTMLVMDNMVVDRVAVQIRSHCLQMSRN